jgi:hypothetical protein
MPKWQIDITRDTSHDAEVVVEAETAEEAKPNRSSSTIWIAT